MAGVYIRAMPLYIRSEEADALARELAARTGMTITDAVTAALAEKLARTPAPADVDHDGTCFRYRSFSVDISNFSEYRARSLTGRRYQCFVRDVAGRCGRGLEITSSGTALAYREFAGGRLFPAGHTGGLLRSSHDGWSTP